MRGNRITIYKRRRPRSDNVNEELQWFCNSLGLFGTRDKDSSCFRMFVVILKSLHSDGLTSDEISEKVGLSRGTVVHHLHKLMGSGIVVKSRNKYLLRVNNLKALVEEIERDLLKTMDDLRFIAEDIDKRMGYF